MEQTQDRLGPPQRPLRPAFRRIGRHLPQAAYGLGALAVLTLLLSSL